MGIWKGLKKAKQRKDQGYDIKTSAENYFYQAIQYQ
jgi:hypothetical protein